MARDTYVAATPPWPNAAALIGTYDADTSTYSAVAVTANGDETGYDLVPPAAILCVGGLTRRMAACYGVVFPTHEGGGRGDHSIGGVGGGGGG